MTPAEQLAAAYAANPESMDRDLLAVLCPGATVCGGAIMLTRALALLAREGIEARQREALPVDPEADARVEAALREIDGPMRSAPILPAEPQIKAVLDSMLTLIAGLNGRFVALENRVIRAEERALVPTLLGGMP